MKKRLLCMCSSIATALIVTVGALFLNGAFPLIGLTEGTLTTFEFLKLDTPWLIDDVTFDCETNDRVLTTTSKQPYLIGETVIPTFTFEGERVLFNGQDITSRKTAVTLLADNTITVKRGNRNTIYRLPLDDQSHGLPVVYIDTFGYNRLSKSDYIDASVTVLGADIYGCENLYALSGGVKLRGNSTADYRKHPFHIRLDEKQSIFGLGSAKHWVLLANFLDPSMMRNTIAYNFGTRLATMTAQNGGTKQFVPRTRAVEVFVNGEFCGLYDLSDHIQIHSTRIDIDKSGEESREVDVGYYLEIEDAARVFSEWENEGAPFVTVNNGGGTIQDELYVQIKSPEQATGDQREFIQQYLQTVNDLILAKDDRVWDYIDKDSFIDWYLTNELFKNTDSAFQSSIKLYKDKGGKLMMGPVWDFDIGAGAVSYNTVSDPTGWLTRSNDRCGWYEALFLMPAFSDAVNARWANLHKNGILDQIAVDIDNHASFIANAATIDHAIWHGAYVSAVHQTDWLHVPFECMYGDWEDQAPYLRRYMLARIAWMDTQFEYTP